MIDVNTLVGPYPFRYTPHPDPQILAGVLEREGTREAWVGHLPSAFWRDPSPGNTELYTMLLPFAGLFRPVPAVRPDWPRWEHALDAAVTAGAPAVRLYPQQWTLGPGDQRLAAITEACGDRGLVVMLTVRFEDLRQRGPLDVAGDLPAATVRHLARVNGRTRIIVTAAGRDMIEEVHWGLTPDEQSRLYWDISWIWGPPEDHLAKLYRSIGAGRFVFGTQWPLRLVQTPRANLELLPDDLAGMPLANPDDIARDAMDATRR
ncbi:MAG: hypothetical protein H0X64_00725 [Gemmatimonadaceae bacterium]|nr:hypothetical protein [Gemmatimonadaceae bacterium]